MGSGTWLGVGPSGALLGLALVALIYANHANPAQVIGCKLTRP